MLHGLCRRAVQWIVGQSRGQSWRLAARLFSHAALATKLAPRVAPHGAGPSRCRVQRQAAGYRAEELVEVGAALGIIHVFARGAAATDRSVKPESNQKPEAHGIESLAQYYTSKIKYDPDGFAEDSAAVEALLRERGFLRQCV